MKAEQFIKNDLFICLQFKFVKNDGISGHGHERTITEIYEINFSIEIEPVMYFCCGTLSRSITLFIKKIKVSSHIENLKSIRIFALFFPPKHGTIPNLVTGNVNSDSSGNLISEILSLSSSINSSTEDNLMRKMFRVKYKHFVTVHFYVKNPVTVCRC